MNKEQCVKQIEPNARKPNFLFFLHFHNFANKQNKDICIKQAYG